MRVRPSNAAQQSTRATRRLSVLSPAFRMQLFYDARDEPAHRTRGSRVLFWLDDLGAAPFDEAGDDAEGFLFAGDRGAADYRRLVERAPGVRERAQPRAALSGLDRVLRRLTERGIDVPTPRTWRLPLDEPLPDDLTYPLFVRTDRSSLKLGGRVSRVENREELLAEAAELRRLLGWDALVLVRAWHDFQSAGEGMYGPVPKEIRVWVVDGRPFAWSFHHLAAVPQPTGFPPSGDDLETLAKRALQIGSAFDARCIAADFAQELDGRWLFLEAGPGSCAGTAHEGVFKAVASRLIGRSFAAPADPHGGLLLGR